jgi:hypothetical protein
VSNAAPTISAISSSNNGTSVTTTWTTDKASNSRVDYGTTSAYGSATSSSALVTSHSLTVTGLATSTTYHFRIQSADSSGNTGSSNDQLLTTSNTIMKNIITDFGAKGDGVTDDGLREQASIDRSYEFTAARPYFSDPVHKRYSKQDCS